MKLKEYKSITVFRYGEKSVVMKNSTGRIIYESMSGSNIDVINKYLDDTDLNVLNSEEDMFLFKIFLESL